MLCSHGNLFNTIGDNIKSKKIISFEKNEFVYHTNETAKGIYCIYSGSIKVFKQLTNKKKITIHKASDGEIIGFNSITQGRFNNSAIALKDTTACFIPLEEMNKLIKLVSAATEMILSSKC